MRRTTRSSARTRSPDCAFRSTTFTCDCCTCATRPASSTNASNSALRLASSVLVSFTSWLTEPTWWRTPSICEPRAWTTSCPIRSMLRWIGLRSILMLLTVLLVFG